MLSGKRIGCLGAGAIIESLIRGVITAGIVRPEQMILTNRSNRERLQRLAQQYGVEVTAEKARVIDEADLLILACKPKDAPTLLAEVGHLMRPEQVVLSLMAGVSGQFIAGYLPSGVQIVRAMPNTSCQVGQSATAIALCANAGIEAAALCWIVLSAVGRVVEVDEPLMDGVTGLSGSGPAYIYRMIEALIRAGEEVGLPVAVARILAVQTLWGAAKMLVETGEEPAHLREQVTSPGGTTMAGLQVLEEDGFYPAIVRAVSRATERSKEMGQANRMLDNPGTQ